MTQKITCSKDTRIILSLSILGTLVIVGLAWVLLRRTAIMRPQEYSRATTGQSFKINMYQMKKVDSCRINQNLVRENQSLNLPPKKARRAWNTAHYRTEADACWETVWTENPWIFFSTPGHFVEEPHNTRFRYWQQHCCRHAMIQQWLLFPCGTEYSRKRGFSLLINTSNIFMDMWGCLKRGRIRCDQNLQYTWSLRESQKICK